MTTWLFDLGNTRVKFAPLLADGGIGGTTALTHGDDDAWLAGLPEGEVACIASVASDARSAALLDGLAARFARLHRARTEPRLGALRIAYANPANLGVDRFLAMLACAGDGASLLVGVGTALTVDLLDAHGRHRGGRIAPSPQLMRQALHQRAAQLPAEGGDYAEFADDTAHALASGCDGAAIGLVERSAEAARALLGEAPLLRVHGGGATVLRDLLPAHRFQPDIVLRGLARWHALRIA
ncbi:type III pantothenate kinase [Thermomonas brevis]